MDEVKIYRLEVVGKLGKLGVPSGLFHKYEIILGGWGVLLKVPGFEVRVQISAVPYRCDPKNF